jgi:hypothetical protein
MRPHRPTLARAIALAPLAALLAACGDSSVLVPRSATLSDAQISRDVAAASGSAVAGDVTDLLTGESAAGLTSAAPATCPYDAASRYHVCPATTSNGLTVARRFQFRDASGTPSQSFDPALTASVNFLRALDGSVSGTGGSDGATWTRGVHETSDRTVSGLAGTETQRVWNGTDTGADTTVYTGSAATRTYAATVTQTSRDVVLSVPRVANSWPLSGTVTRVVTARLTTSASTAVRNVARTVTVTFNGTSVVPIEVNGLACKLDLATRSISGCP